MLDVSGKFEICKFLPLAKYILWTTSVIVLNFHRLHHHVKVVSDGSRGKYVFIDSGGQYYQNRNELKMVIVVMMSSVHTGRLSTN